MEQVLFLLLMAYEMLGKAVNEWLGMAEEVMSFCIFCLIEEMQGTERVLFCKVSERNCQKAESGSHRRKRKCIREQVC